MTSAASVAGVRAGSFGPHSRASFRPPPPTATAPRLPLALSLAALSATAPKTDPERHGWFTDYPAALVQARKTGKPIFLIFRCDP